MTNKKFDCVDWVRNIRNSEYEKNKHLSLSDYAENMSKEVHESQLYKELITDRGVHVISPPLAK
ncbi:MAG: hypothetical protein ABUK01_03205 [Leptospirales bacterium]